MKARIMFLLAAFMMLFGVSANAQNSETPIKGDVNGDGVVDVADINAIIDIMKNSGETPETTCYWYVGQTDPSTMTEISPIVTDMTSPGWREIDTSIGSWSYNSPLWNGALNSITTGPTKQVPTYVALPNVIINPETGTTFKMRDGEGDVLDAWINNGTKLINGVNYTIYQSPGGMKVFNNIVY